MRLRKRPDGRGGRGPRGRSPVRHRKGEPAQDRERTRARAAIRAGRSRRHPRAWRHACAHDSNRARPLVCTPRRGADAGEPGLLVSPAQLRHCGPHSPPLGRHSRGVGEHRGTAGCRVDAKESGPHGADLVLGREGAAELWADAPLGKEASVPLFSLGKGGHCRSAGCRVVLGSVGGFTLSQQASLDAPLTRVARRSPRA